MDTPTRPLIALPTLTEIKEAIRMDRYVAIVALLVGGAVVYFVVDGLVAVVERGGDVAAVAFALTAVIGAVAGAWAKRSKSNDPPG